MTNNKNEGWRSLQCGLSCAFAVKQQQLMLVWNSSLGRFRCRARIGHYKTCERRGRAKRKSPSKQNSFFVDDEAERYLGQCESAKSRKSIYRVNVREGNGDIPWQTSNRWNSQASCALSHLHGRYCRQRFFLAKPDLELLWNDCQNNV